MAATGDTSGGSPTDPDDINARLAEIHAELAKPSRFTEPSAADRARGAPRRSSRSGRPPRGKRLTRQEKRLAAELRKPVQGANPAPARRAPAPAPRPRRAPAPGPVADRGYTAPSRRRGPGPKYLIIAIVVVAALYGAAVGLHAVLHSKGLHLGGLHLGAPNPASQAPLGFNPAAPFAGSPAATYQNGAAGIVAPPARSYGQFSAAQVAADYATTRQLLIDAHLNLPTLQGGAPLAFEALLATQQRSWFIAHLNATGVSKQGAQQSSRAWVTSFVPGSTELIGDVIKVHGSMTASAARLDGQPAILVHADYLFVYPVEMPGRPGTGLRIVDRAWLEVYFGPWDRPASQQTVPWIEQILGTPVGARCEVARGYVLPYFPGSAPQPQQGHGSVINPYDTSTPPPTGGGCHPATGT
jgi:hypothetical protein